MRMICGFFADMICSWTMDHDQRFMRPGRSFSEPLALLQTNDMFLHEREEREYPPVSSAPWLAGKWTVEIGDVPLETSIRRGVSSQPCLIIRCLKLRCYTSAYHWLVVWNFFTFPYIGNVIIPVDELIFFRGVGIPPTRWWLHMAHTTSIMCGILWHSIIEMFFLMGDLSIRVNGGTLVL